MSLAGLGCKTLMGSIDFNKNVKSLEALQQIIHSHTNLKFPVVVNILVIIHNTIKLLLSKLGIKK